MKIVKFEDLGRRHSFNELGPKDVFVSRFTFKDGGIVISEILPGIIEGWPGYSPDKYGETRMKIDMAHLMSYGITSEDFVESYREYFQK